MGQKENQFIVKVYGAWQKGIEFYLEIMIGIFKEHAKYSTVQNLKENLLKIPNFLIPQKFGNF